MEQRLSLFTQHVARWEHCTRCSLHECRHNVVLARGRVPCDVLFIGEAPGVSEDMIGQPFVGPAGELLDKIIAASVGDNGAEFRYAITNLVACMPTDEDGLKAHVPPHITETEKCSPRLQELFTICSPRALVCVGGTARDHLDIALPKKFRGNVLVTDVTHPSAILRQNVAQRGLSVQRCIVRINELLRDLRTLDAGARRRAV